MVFLSLSPNNLQMSHDVNNDSNCFAQVIEVTADGMVSTKKISRRQLLRSSGTFFLNLFLLVAFNDDIVHLKFQTELNYELSITTNANPSTRGLQLWLNLRMLEIS